MKNRILKYTLSLFLLSIKIFSQSPDFDWRTSQPHNYDMILNINIQNTPYNVASPYWRSTANLNRNLFSFWEQSIKDYEPNDGWNLVHYFFGDNNLLNPQSPSFATGDVELIVCNDLINKESPFFCPVRCYHLTAKLFV